jgi:hypothetical protein
VRIKLVRTAHKRLGSVDHIGHASFKSRPLDTKFFENGYHFRIGVFSKEPPNVRPLGHLGV